MEVICKDRNPAQVARSYEVHPNKVRSLIKKFKENGTEVSNKDGDVNQLAP